MAFFRSYLFWVLLRCKFFLKEIDLLPKPFVLSNRSFFCILMYIVRILHILGTSTLLSCARNLWGSSGSLALCFLVIVFLLLSDKVNCWWSLPGCIQKSILSKKCLLRGYQRCRDQILFLVWFRYAFCWSNSNAYLYQSYWIWVVQVVVIYQTV